MSRCFPYPPPGYEKKARNDARSDHVDLLSEGKHKEEKHKKEKRDKENREGIKRKEKDRSKNKYKEKKDRKEKHKDKKKKKDKDKGGSRTSEDRTEKQIQSHPDYKLGGSWKTKEFKRSKFTDGLDCWIKNEETVKANGKVDNFTCSVQRSFDSSGAEAAIMERVASNKAIPASVDSLPRRINGMERPADKFPRSIQSRTEVLGSANAVQKERNTTNNMVSNLTRLGRRGNGDKEQSVDISRVSVRQGSDNRYTATAVEKENCKYDKVVSNPSKTVQRSFNGMGRSAESLSILAYRKVDGIGLVKAVEDRGEIKKFVPIHIFIEQMEEDGICRSMKDVDKRIEGNEKIREADGYSRKEERNKVRDQTKKKKDKLDEKEQKHQEYDEIRGIGKKDQIDGRNLELLASRGDQKKSNNSDVNKKRNELDMNGLLFENDVQPNKFQRTTQSTHLVENGRTVDLSHVACSSKKPEAINNVKAGKVFVDNKEHIDGTRVAQPSSDGLRCPPVVDNVTGQICLKPPHPDSKYLNEIYSVPKMDDLPEFDDQEWLCSSHHLHSKPKTKLEADGMPKVWAEALRIGSVDIVALPYVIPF